MKFTDAFQSSYPVLSTKTWVVQCYMCLNSPSDLVHEFMHLSAFHESLLLNATAEYPLGNISVNTSINIKALTPVPFMCNLGGKRTIHLTSTALACHKRESNINNSGSAC